MVNKRIKILIACHKPFPVPHNDQYLPLQLGKRGASIDLGIQGDNEGDNISEKNYCYCELTALYWAWKNLKDVDVIGLCHYRRYFDFHKQGILFMPDASFPISAIEELDFSMNEKVINDVLKGGVVVPRALSWNSTLEQQYCMGHVSEDYRILREVFFESQSDMYKKAFDEIMVKGYKFHPYNMMVMRWVDFDLYCRWLFGLISKIENRTDISQYSAYQKRIYGFMAERLLNIWLRAENKPTIERPILFFSENSKKRFPRRCAPRKTFKLVKSEFRCYLINWHYRKSL